LRRQVERDRRKLDAVADAIEDKLDAARDKLTEVRESVRPAQVWRSNEIALAVGALVLGFGLGRVVRPTPLWRKIRRDVRSSL